VPSRLALAVVAALAAGCAAGARPASLAELEAAVDKGAPGSQAQAEASRYLALARDAADAGNGDEARRLAELGLIEARFAAAQARQAEARARLDTARRRGEKLARDQERLEGLIDAEERGRERARIRRHVEDVVDAERRKAAAEEELRGAVPAEVDDARVQIGREMIAGAEVELDALAAQGVREEDLSPARAALGTARVRLAAKDVAGVQEHAEDAAVAMREVRERLRDEARPDPAQAMVASLRAAGIEASTDDLGVVVPLGDPFAKGAALSPAGQAGARALGRALAAHPEARLLVLSSATALSDKKAEAFAAALEAAGVPRPSITVRGCGASSPIDALRPPANGRRDRAAVLLVFAQGNR
jgi:hypothetical protein